MIRINAELTPEKLKPRLERLFEISAQKIRALEKAWDPSRGAPAVTVRGVYAAREWTDWTEGFLYGSPLLQFDAVGEQWFLDYGRRGTVERMAPHLTHLGGHDHGFNNVSTYGNLLRMGDLLNYKAHRLLLNGQSLVREYETRDIPAAPAIGTTNPADPHQPGFHPPLADEHDRLTGA